MGKQIISQRRGRGTTTFRAHSFRHVSPVLHRPYDSIEKNSAIKGQIMDLIKCSGHSAPLAKIKYSNGEISYIFAFSNLKVNDFIEFKYNFSAIRPSFKTKYEFPLKLTTFFNKYKDKTIDFTDNYYKITNNLANEMLPKLNVIHKRRNIIISKAIFPGRETDEFGISISVINKSNVEINDVKITDTISKYFELISSNFEAEILKTEDKNKNILSFTINSILPYQEKEIRYYIQNKSGKEIGYDELESYIFG